MTGKEKWYDIAWWSPLKRIIGGFAAVWALLVATAYWLAGNPPPESSLGAKPAARQYDPAAIPGFNRYKQSEQAIIAEVAAMDGFADEAERQAYLRQRLLEARIEAYQQTQ